MINPKEPEIKVVQGQSGMEYDVSVIRDPVRDKDVDRIQAGEIKGTALTPIYEGD